MEKLWVAINLLIGCIFLTLLDCKYKPPIAESMPLSGLSNKPVLEATIQHIFISDKSLYNSEGNNILMKIQIKNKTNENVELSWGQVSTDEIQANSLLLNSNHHTSDNASHMPIGGFYLLSNELKTGALKLQPVESVKNIVIAANHSETCDIWSNCVYLSYFLKESHPRDQDKQYDKLLDFLNRGIYSMILVAPEDSVAVVVRKSAALRITITNSITSRLNKLPKN